MYEYFVSEKKYRRVAIQTLTLRRKKKNNNKKHIRSLHKILGKNNCTKIKISLARSLFSKTKSEDLGINLVWPKAL